MHFLDRSSVRLDRANLTNVGGDFNYSVVYESASKPTGRDILLSKILPQAMHGNEGPSDEQRCHGRTHHSITGDIKSWLQTKNRLHNVLLLIGPAGTGKTILTKTVIADLNQPDSPTKLAGSFFFSSGDSGRNSAERFVLTLAYQLTGLATEIGQRIDHILNRDPHISTSGLEQQWRRLIIEPVNGMSDVLPPSVFIIEGLDQCGTPLEQSQVLQLVASSGSTFPIAFFITSKPEYHIRTFFKADALAVLCRKAISLTEITTEVRNDVKAFLRSRLADIHARNRDILGPVPLASEADIQNLARSAAGHFIYVSAFLRFIDDHRENPRIRAEQYFSRSREATHALTPLDGYYGHILSKSHHPTNSFVQNILFHIIFCNEVDMVASLSRIAALEGCNTHLIRTALRHLHSVLEVPEEDHEHVRVYDPSFIDYLYDYERSGSYFIDRSYYAALTVVQCLKNLTHTSHNRHPQWWFDNSYGWLRYIEHVNLASPPQDFIFSLQQFDFHRWLSEYARQPYSLHNRYAVFQKLLKRSSLGKYLQDLHPDTLVEARHFWLAELCSYNIEVGRIYLQLLGRLPVVPRLPTWSAIHSLVSTHLRLTGLSLQLDTNWPLFCYAVEEVVPSVPNWFMGDSQLSQQFAHVEGCMSRHDVVLAALTILRHPEYLSYDDLEYFSLHWSAAWDWESELWCDMPSKEALEPIRVQTILAALGRLPKQFHKHALHSPQVLAWIEVWVSSPSPPIASLKPSCRPTYLMPLTYTGIGKRANVRKSLPARDEIEWKSRSQAIHYRDLKGRNQFPLLNYLKMHRKVQILQQNFGPPTGEREASFRTDESTLVG
ncbi:hypothetical protein AX16_002738 [Volvariella volvacea WC 439]|nr:hypothetical protein AX16_002738 [Volvariella volvacea WC 439]